MEQKDIYEAIGEFQKRIGSLQKDSTGKIKTKSGTDYSYKYLSLPRLLEKINPILQELKMVMIQCPSGLGKLKTTIVHTPSSTKVEGEIEMKAIDDRAQTFGSLLTYERRYSIAPMLGLVIDEDDDGAAASGNSIKNTDEIPF